MLKFPATLLLILLLAGMSASGAATCAGADVGKGPTAGIARFLLEWGKKGSGPGEFNFPIGIAVSSADEIFVTDHYNNRLQKFRSDGKFLSEFPVLQHPGGIALDEAGNIYLSHFGESRSQFARTPDRISVYDANGKFVREWGKSGKADGEFDMPGGIAIGRDGRVYVADQTNRRIQVFDRNGKFLAKWGEYGVKPGQFGGNSSRLSRVGGPQFVALDRAGDVYTTEGSLGRVQKFTSDGKFLLAWGDNKDAPGSFGGAFTGFKATLQGPIAICIDRENCVWVSAVCGRIQRFSNDGKFLGGFGGEQGKRPGQFFAPHGIAFDSHGDLYVVDAYNQRIQKFAVVP